MRKWKGACMARDYAQSVVAPRLPWWHLLDMDNLARLRDARGLTQSQLAQMVGANQATISKIEKGVGNPTLDMIQRIAGALRVHPSELFARDTLHQRVVDAVDRLESDSAKEAALIVLEAMGRKG